MIETGVDLEEVTAIARRHRELGEVIADLAQQRVDLEARFEALVPVGFEAVVDGKPIYRRSPNRSFNVDVAVNICRSLGLQPSPVWSYDTDELKRLLKASDKLDDAMLPGTGKNRVTL